MHIIGHASLRTYQFLRAPSSFQYYKSLEDSLGKTDLNKNSTTIIPSYFSLVLYSFALNRGGMDSMLERFIARPFLMVFKFADIIEKKWLLILNGTQKVTSSDGVTK